MKIPSNADIWNILFIINVDQTDGDQSSKDYSYMCSERYFDPSSYLPAESIPNRHFCSDRLRDFSWSDNENGGQDVLFRVSK